MGVSMKIYAAEPVTVSHQLLTSNVTKKNKQKTFTVGGHWGLGLLVTSAVYCQNVLTLTASERVKKNEWIKRDTYMMMKINEWLRKLQSDS